MKETLLKMKRLFAGTWRGEGFAKFPTIHSSAYTEHLEFIPDEYKDAICFRQKTWYKNDTDKNGQTVFWDIGFIVLKEDTIVLHSTQVGGRMEMYDLVQSGDDRFTFNSVAILHDPKSIRSQRIFTVNGDHFHYELNMATHQAPFQNHLLSDLKKENNMITALKTPDAPAPIAPFSQAVVAGNFVYVSAQLGRDIATGEMMSQNIETETKQVMENIKSILKSAGVDFSRVVKASIFLKDMQDFARMNNVYASYFKEPYPARETIQVVALPTYVNIEISVIAMKND